MIDSAIYEPSNPETIEQLQEVGQPITPGAQLAVYRQVRGWSIEQVANQLNLTPRQIQAIEEDNYLALPGMAITRGFIRVYAKLLKVDATPLLVMMERLPITCDHLSTQLRNPLSAPFSEGYLPLMGGNKRSFSKLSIVLFLLALLLIVAIVNQRIVHLPELSDLKLNAEKILAFLARPLLPSNTPIPVSNIANPVIARATSTNLVSKPAALADTNAEFSITASDEIVHPINKEPTKNTLVLQLREDSWVEIRRVADKRVLISRLLKGGTSEPFQISEPISLVIGNAAGVDAVLRGVPIDLKVDKNANVARLDLK